MLRLAARIHMPQKCITGLGIYQDLRDTHTDTQTNGYFFAIFRVITLSESRQISHLFTWQELDRLVRRIYGSAGILMLFLLVLEVSKRQMSLFFVYAQAHKYCQGHY